MSNCRCKYAVVINMPGYMPDRENTCHPNLAEANATAQWEINQFREYGYTIIGSLKQRSWYAKPNQGGSAYYISIVTINESYGYAESCECDSCQ